MKPIEAHNATVKTLQQVARILKENPSFLPEYVQTRLDDLGDIITEPDVDSPSPRKAEMQPRQESENNERAAKQHYKTPEKWKQVLRFIERTGRASLSQVRAYIESDQPVIKEVSIRSQLAEYVNRGILKRPEKGIYEITETGKE